jgi:methyl-accepting chemotaxis protein-1 (serine sensor receptor)
VNQLKISTRLWMLIGVLSALLIAIGGVGLYSTAQSNEALHATYQSRLLPAGQISEIQKLLLRNRLAIATSLVTPDAQTIGPATDEVEANIATITRIWEAYMATSLNADERTIAQAFAEARAKFVQQGLRPAVAALRANDIAGANRVVVEAVRPLYGPVNEGIDALMQYQLHDAQNAYEAALQRYGTVRMLSVGSILVGVLFAALFGAALIRGISGSLDHAIEIADAVAEGHLSQAIQTRGADEVSQLLHALTSMQGNLSKVVSTVRSGSEGVATASAQIASGNHDLSARTEQTASALQETAAAMEELNATVQKNALAATQANQVAQEVSTTAKQGGTVVTQVVDTMRGINESSRKIADIIGVIDGIAFQTNILALNAAVEAARAGEQGRGFAVVAGEVRSLAGRSAEASKEIKNLISDSVDRVEQGTALVNQAGVTMGEVVNGIQRVTDLMGEISMASHEQSQGVAQVGEAVKQMDQVTQQNAALVEEMAAAASSLKSQANDLVDTVAIFKLTADAHPIAAHAASLSAPLRPMAIAHASLSGA